MLNTRNIELCRSLLFTPAIQIDRFKKALLGEADVVCLDLEDGVAPSHKEMAREKAIPLLFGEIKPLTAVKALRINPIKTQTGMQDLLALCKFGQAPSVILLPKVDAPEEVLWVSEILDEVAYSDTKLFVIIETAKGLERATEIANASPRISTLLFGAADLSAELGSSQDWEALHYARGRVVHAASSAGLDVVDVPHLDIKDESKLKHYAYLAQRMGFTGKAAIHPLQISIINEIFSPSSETVEYARKVITAYEESTHGVTLLDGKVIEIPVVKAMRRALLISEKVSTSKK